MFLLMEEHKGSAKSYLSLGKKLKNLREAAKQSIVDVSGAVEIDATQLARYELGQGRPSEDVLLLILSYFDVEDSEAAKIWEMAGYNLSKTIVPDSISEKQKTDLASKSSVDQKHIIFTDVVDVIVNNYGVVMNFMQNSGSKSEPVTVARVGMSREHAKSVLKILQMTLNQTEKSPQQEQKSSDIDKA